MLSSVAEAAVGLGGLKPPLDPKTPWSPPLAPPSFWRKKDEEEGEEEERKEEISPPFKNFWIRHWFCPLGCTPVPATAGFRMREALVTLREAIYRLGRVFMRLGLRDI